MGPFDAELTNLPRLQLPFPGLEIDDLLFLIGHCHAHGVQFDAPLIHGIQVRHWRRFRQSVPLQHGDLHFLLHPLRHVGRQRCGSHHNVAQVRQSVLRQAGEIVQRHQDRRHRVVQGHPVLLRQHQRALQVKGLHDHQRGPCIQTSTQQHNAVDVIKRQKNQQGVLLGDTPARHELDVIRHQILLGQHDAFRETCRTTGIGQGRQILSPVERGLRWVLRCGLPDEVTEEMRPRFSALTNNNDLAQTRKL